MHYIYIYIYSYMYIYIYIYVYICKLTRRYSLVQVKSLRPSYILWRRAPQVVAHALLEFVGWTPALPSEPLLAHDVYVCLERPSGTRDWRLGFRTASWERDMHQCVCVRACV